MDITIKIDDDSRFNDIIKNELNALNPEELHEIIISVIKEALTANNYEIIKSLLVEERSTGWCKAYEPTQLTISIIEKCDYSQMQDIVNNMIDYLKNNHKDLLEKILINIFDRGLCNSYSFRESVENVFTDIRYREANS